MDPTLGQRKDSGRMEEKTATTAGSTGTGSRIHLKTIFSPSESVMLAAEAAEAERQQDALPKEPAPWQATQLDPSLSGKAAGAALPRELEIGAAPQEPQMGASGVGQDGPHEWRTP